jgi:hypothetical protein
MSMTGTGDGSPPQDASELVGPFRRPLQLDWALWVYIGIVAFEVARQARHAFSVANLIALALPVPIGWFVLFSLTVGLVRRYREGRRRGRGPRTATGTAAPADALGRRRTAPGRDTALTTATDAR